MLSSTPAIVTMVLVVILVLCLIVTTCCEIVEPFTPATPINPNTCNTCVTFEANPKGNVCPDFNVNKPIYLNTPVTAHGGLMVDKMSLEEYLKTKMQIKKNPAVDASMISNQKSFETQLTQLQKNTSKLNSDLNVGLKEKLTLLKQARKGFLKDVTKGLPEWQPVHALGSSDISPWNIVEKPSGTNVKDAQWISYSPKGRIALPTTNAIMYKNTFYPCQTQQQKMGRAPQDPRTYTLHFHADNYATAVWINDQFVGNSSTENWWDPTHMTIHIEPPKNNDGTKSMCTTATPQVPTTKQAQASNISMHIPQQDCTVYTKTPLRIYIVVMNYGTSPITKTSYGNSANPHGLIATLKDITNPDVLHTDSTWEYCVVDSAAVMMKIMAEVAVETADDANTKAPLCGESHSSSNTAAPVSGQHLSKSESPKSQTVA